MRSGSYSVKDECAFLTFPTLSSAPCTITAKANFPLCTGIEVNRKSVRDLFCPDHPVTSAGTMTGPRFSRTLILLYSWFQSVNSGQAWLVLSLFLLLGYASPTSACSNYSLPSDNLWGQGMLLGTVTMTWTPTTMNTNVRVFPLAPRPAHLKLSHSGAETP